MERLLQNGGCQRELMRNRRNGLAHALPPTKQSSHLLEEAPFFGELRSLYHQTLR